MLGDRGNLEVARAAADDQACLYEICNQVGLLAGPVLCCRSHRRWLIVAAKLVGARLATRDRLTQAHGGSLLCRYVESGQSTQKIRLGHGPLHTRGFFYFPVFFSFWRASASCMYLSGSRASLMESTDLVHNYSATREGVCQPRRFTHLACDAPVFLRLTRRGLLSFC